MTLACTVRGCGLPLQRQAHAWVCPAGHGFDVARSGYVNLLQPQDRRSRAPGDSSPTVRARRALLDSGFGSALEAALVGLFERGTSRQGDPLADLGCGEGTFLASLVARFGLAGYGVDISTHAIQAAAARHPGITWIVANADRRLPFLDRSLAVVVSVDGRQNLVECARVLAPGGRCILGVPAADDLLELRESVLGRADDLDRTRTILEGVPAGFTVEEHVVARDRRLLGAEQLEQLAAATYRCARNAEKHRLGQIRELTVTTSHDLFCLRLHP